MAKKGKILVVDDNAGVRSSLKILLSLHFAEVQTLPSPNALLQKMEEYRPDVVLLDMNFHAAVNTGNEGLYWIRRLRGAFPETEVVLFTAYADVALAVEGMKCGAFDFIVKPWENETLISTLCAARDRSEKPAPLRARTPDGMYWGGSARMQAIRATVMKAAPSDLTILITGENGTGKDMLAREIHSLSRRRDKEMVAVDAGAIPETLFESELFGHVKGAFTGAHADHAGKFEQADGGTLFLDEIGNIPLHLQAKLLRALQSRSIVRVGGTAVIPVDIRLICATNMDLGALVREGKFREDLYYRINAMHIELPPLRERAEDIVPLAERFCLELSRRYGRNIRGLDREAGELLRARPWRGNIRELYNCVEKAVVLSEQELIGPDDLLPGAPQEPLPDERPREGMSEEALVRDAMERSGGNVSKAAKLLRVSRPTMYARIRKYKLG